MGDQTLELESLISSTSSLLLAVLLAVSLAVSLAVNQSCKLDLLTLELESLITSTPSLLLEVNQTSQLEKESIMSLKQSRRSVKSLEVILFQRNKNRRLLVPFNRSVSLLVLTRSLPNFTTLLEATNTLSKKSSTGMEKSAKLMVLLRLFQWSTFQMSRVSCSTLFTKSPKRSSHLLKKL